MAVVIHPWREAVQRGLLPEQGVQLEFVQVEPEHPHADPSDVPPNTEWKELWPLNTQESI
jgi:hypothetical protein